MRIRKECSRILRLLSEKLKKLSHCIDRVQISGLFKLHTGQNFLKNSSRPLIYPER
jgi:hypothetical protein